MDGLPGAPFGFEPQLPPVLECSGEFGAELNSFVPFVYWLHQAGRMRGRKVLTYRGMRAFYFFLDDSQLIEKPTPRAYVAPQQRPSWLPNRDDHASRRSAFEMFPDYRARFGGDARFACDRELLVVHNKFSVEWDRAPVNYIPIQALGELLEALRTRFRIVYLRPGIVPPPGGYSIDHQTDLSFADRALLSAFPDVLVFEEMAAALLPGMDYNEAKLRLYAHAHFHLSVQGGNAHMGALFSGSLVSILHRVGQEIRHSYRDGHFTYAANPAPTYLICRDLGELGRAAEVMRQGVVVDGRVLLPPDAAAQVMALSPGVQCGADKMLPADLRAAQDQAQIRSAAAPSIRRAGSVGRLRSFT